MIKIALIQKSCMNDEDKNLHEAIDMIKEAARMGANMVCLPELFLGPYFCQKKNDKEAFLKAKAIPGPSTHMLSKLAKELNIVLIGGSLFEKTNEGRHFNTAPVFNTDGALLGLHRKIHIPEDPLFHEQHYFESSQEGVKVFDTAFGKIAVLICFDQWFPEAARLATLAGAQVIFYPTAIGQIDDQVEKNITGNWQQMWTNAMLGHAASNNVYVCAVNRVGLEGHLHFWGGSFIADPSSNIIAKAKTQANEIVMASVDLSKVKALQEAWGFLRNRQPQTYQSLCKKNG